MITDMAPETSHSSVLLSPEVMLVGSALKLLMTGTGSVGLVATTGSWVDSLFEDEGLIDFSLFVSVVIEQPALACFPGIHPSTMISTRIVDAPIRKIPFLPDTFSLVPEFYFKPAGFASSMQTATE